MNNLLVLLILAACIVGNPLKSLSLHKGLLTGDPCEKAKPYIEKTNSFSRTEVYQTALIKIKGEAAHAPGTEHIVSFGRDADGNITASGISTGKRSSGYIPGVTNGFADLHNHPKNTPPSSGDLYGLMKKNRKNSDYDTRYVITQAGTVYAFVITDTTAAVAFLLKYPSQQTPGYSPLFPDPLLDEYRDMQYKYNIAEEMAMAYILERYKAGVSLLKQDENGKFKKLRTLLSNDGDNLVFTASYCN